MNIAELVNKAKNGDNEAYGKLFELTYQKAYYTALKITKNESDAEDILQEAYIKALSKLDTLQDPGKFASWFNCIVANLCKSYVVKHKPDFFSQYDNDSEDISFEDRLENTDNSLVPQDVLDNNETKCLVMQCIDTLSEEHKMCIIMYYYDEMSIREIAESLGISENTVKTRLHYAKKKLKGEFEELEKKGTKLYGLGLIPLIRIGVENVPLPVDNVGKILASVTQKLGTASATTTASAVATATTGAKAVAGFTTKKLVACIIAVAVAGSVATGTAVGVKNTQKQRAESTSVVTQLTTEEATQDVFEQMSVTENTTEAISQDTTKPDNTTQKETTSKKKTTTQASTKKKTTAKAKTEKPTEDDDDIDEIDVVEVDDD